MRNCECQEIHFHWGVLVQIERLESYCKLCKNWKRCRVASDVKENSERFFEAAYWKMKFPFQFRCLRRIVISNIMFKTMFHNPICLRRRFTEQCDAWYDVSHPNARLEAGRHISMWWLRRRVAFQCLRRRFIFRCDACDDVLYSTQNSYRYKVKTNKQKHTHTHKHTRTTLNISIHYTVFVF